MALKSYLLIIVLVVVPLLTLAYVHHVALTGECQSCKDTLRRAVEIRATESTFPTDCTMHLRMAH